MRTLQALSTAGALALATGCGHSDTPSQSGVPGHSNELAKVSFTFPEKSLPLKNVNIPAELTASFADFLSQDSQRSDAGLQRIITSPKLDEVVPLLVQIGVNDRAYHGTIANALNMRGMGYQKPVALLTAVLESGQPKQVENAAWMLSYFRTNAESSVPNLLAVLSDERLKNAFFPSIEALGAIAPGSRHATNVATRLGALLEEKSYWPLKEESIATTLGKLGADAFSTLPVLDSFIGDGLSEKRHTGSLEKRQIVIAIGEIAQAGHSRGLTYNPMKLTEIFKDDYAALSLHKQTAEVFSTVFPDFLKTFPQIANRVAHLLKL